MFEFAERSSVVGACAAAMIVFTAAGAAAQSAPAGAPGLPAWKDAATGAVSLVPPPSAPTAAVPRAGRVVLKVTITIASSLPATVRPTCRGYLNHFGGTGMNFYTHTSVVSATRTGNTATCTLSMPYSWPDVTLANKISTSVEIRLNPFQGPTATIPTARSVTVMLPSVDFPANGGIASVTYAHKL
jgi:hypothetical protein